MPLVLDIFMPPPDFAFLLPLPIFRRYAFIFAAAIFIFAHTIQNIQTFYDIPSPLHMPLRYSRYAFR